MGKHHGQNSIVRGWGGEQFVQVLQCLMKASLLENGPICLKSFVQGCSFVAHTNVSYHVLYRGPYI